MEESIFRQRVIFFKNNNLLVVFIFYNSALVIPH